MRTSGRLMAATVVTAACGLGTAGPALAGGAPAFTVSGRLAGSAATIATNPDTGVHYRVHGHGTTSLGATKVRGNVYGPGFVRAGYCTATLVLTTGKGSATVAVRATRPVPGGASCRGGFSFAWHTTRTTGAYAGRRGSGTGTLTVSRPATSGATTAAFHVTFAHR